MYTPHRSPPQGDYARIARAIAYLDAHADQQPSLGALAAHLGMSSGHLQRLFSRWAGVSPKRFLQALTVERAQRLLAEGRPVLEVADRVGLSSGSRLHDHFVALEATTPGEFGRGGEGLTIVWGVHATPFGDAFVAQTPRGVCAVAFVDDAPTRANARDRLVVRWPHAVLREDQVSTADVAKRMFAEVPPDGRPLSLHVAGTNFQVSVWRALLAIPPARAVTYGGLAAALGRPGASRAVGSAVGANPVALFIPCHRVIARHGGLGGYRWGTTRKRIIQLHERLRQPVRPSPG